MSYEVLINGFFGLKKKNRFLLGFQLLLRLRGLYREKKKTA